MVLFSLNVFIQIVPMSMSFPIITSCLCCLIVKKNSFNPCMNQKRNIQKCSKKEKHFKNALNQNPMYLFHYLKKYLLKLEG